MKNFIEKNYKILAGLMLGFIFAVSIINARNDSAIFDETAHIGAAYSYVSQGEIRLNPEHPPLIKDLAGIPLALMSLNFDVSRPFWTGELPNKWDEGQWAAGRHLLYETGNDADKILFWARFPIILLSILLGCLIFKWTRELAGKSAGLFALALYVFNPNILGHNHYVTTDIGIAAFTAFAFYYFIKFIKKPSWKNVLIGGFFLGLVQLAKFSSITIFPIMGLILVAYPLIRIHNKKGKFQLLGEYLGKGVIAFFISLLVVWVCYFANTINMTQATVAKTIDVNFPESNNDNPKNLYTNKVLHAFNSHKITRPLATYGIGMGYVFRRVSGGNGAYFMGQVSSSAFLSYFPTVFLIKEPLTDLFFMISAIIAASFLGFRNFFAKGKEKIGSLLEKAISFLRSHITSVSIFLYIILYSYISITGNLNIGLRHLFPIFPFAFILTAKIVFDFIKSRKEYFSRTALYLSVFLLLIVSISQSISAFPNYMSYFNPIVGGPKNGYKYVTDSNADWGQDLKRLKVFLEDHPEIKNIRVDYFGGGDLDYYLGEKNYVQWWDSKRPIEKGWYAISTNFLQGSIYSKDKTINDSYRWLIERKPDYQIGTSILIYNVVD